MPRPATFCRTEVVESAKRVFCKKGYSKTSMQDLVKATGLHPGSLYGAFSNKENLFNECIKSDLDTLFERLDETFTKHSSAIDGLEDYFLQHWHDSLQVPDEANLRFIFKASLEVDEELPESSKIISESVAKRSALIIAHIEKAQQEGDIRTDITAVDINSFLTMGSLGLRCMQQYYLEPQPKNSSIDIMLNFIKAKI